MATRSSASTPGAGTVATATGTPRAVEGTAVPPGAASKIGVGDVPGCLGGADPTRYLRQYGAAVLRVIVTPMWGGLGSNGEARPCLQAATAAGYRLHLVIQYANDWSTQQAASYFQQVLSHYAPYAWAVSVGNEQELYQGGPGRTGDQYAADWRVLEPLVAQLAPDAIRVAGEISPWGWQFLKRAVDAGLPGAQALAAHVYTKPHHFRIPDFEQWCRSIDMAYWFTEGASYPGSRAPVVPVAQLQGAQVIESWLGY
jgi:hypothetical protein